MTHNETSENTAYPIEYLPFVISLHRLVFIKLSQEEYDTFSLIDAYMRTSDIRHKMDIGNWSALNKGHKQVLNSIDRSGCVKKTEDISDDDILLHWLADIYVLLQWRYSLSSKDISERIPAKRLSQLYYPLHEASEKIACEKLYHKFYEVENR